MPALACTKRHVNTGCTYYKVQYRTVMALSLVTQRKGTPTHMHYTYPWMMGSFSRELNTYPVHNKPQCGELAWPVANQLLSKNSWKCLLQSHCLKPCKCTTWVAGRQQWTARTCAHVTFNTIINTLLLNAHCWFHSLHITTSREGGERRWEGVEGEGRG